MSGNLIAGSRSPHAVRLTITASDDTLDMATVTACTVVRRSPNGVDKSWSTVIDATTPPVPAVGNVPAVPSTLTVHHTLADDKSDVPDYGGYVLSPVLTVPLGEIACVPVPLPVDDSFGA